MKVEIELDPSATDVKVKICAPEITSQVKQIYQKLQAIGQHPDQIAAKKGNTQYYLNLAEIIFFETENKQVVAHTVRDAFSVDHKLYELENLLSSQFMRVSKSTILNLQRVYAVTRSISNCKVSFRDSYKSVYVSRHYYHNLNDRLVESRRLS